MSELWRMERKRDKNAREMKVQGLGQDPGSGSAPGHPPELPHPGPAQLQECGLSTLCG